MKTFAEKLLGGRKEVLVGILKVLTLNQKILRLPKNLKFKPKELYIGRHSLEELLPILELPKALLFLEITIWKFSYMENPIVQNVDYLTLNYNSQIHSIQFWLDTLPTIPSKNIYLAGANLKGKEIRRIVENKIENGEVIGKSYTLGCSGKKSMDKCVMKSKKEFKGFFVTVTEKAFKEIRCINTPIVSLPMKDLTSELVMYGIRYNNRLYIRIRVIEAGSGTPVAQNGGFFSWFQWRKTK